MYKGAKFQKEYIFDVQTYYKPTENFQYTNFYQCHPPGITKGFIKGQALRLVRKNSSKTFEENGKNFEKHLLNKGYPTNVVGKHLSEVKFSDRKSVISLRLEMVPFDHSYNFLILPPRL